MKIGLRLRWLDEPGRDFHLGDLLDFVEHADASSAIYRALHRDATDWGLAEQLLAGIFDRLQMDAWINGGGKGPKPKQIPRPGVVQSETKTYKVKKPTSITEMEAWLAKRRQSA